MNFVTTILSAEGFQEIEACGSKYAVRVNPKEYEGDDTMLVCHECIIDHIPTQLELEEIGRSALQRDNILLLNSSNSECQREIEQLKKELSESDYQFIKFSEGWLSEEEYMPIKAERQNKRVRINQLEAMIESNNTMLASIGQ